MKNGMSASLSGGEFSARKYLDLYRELLLTG